MARSGLSKKDKAILLLRQSETISTIIAGEVGGDAANISVVRNGFLRSQKA
jgi:hypothetical protein